MTSRYMKFDDLSSINESRRDWKIRVRVVRFWRGSTKQGQPFSNFNLLLIDKQETKIQAFVPAKCNELLQDQLALGTTCSITHFDVERYKAEEKFRTVFNEYRLVFGEDTKVKILDDKETKLPEDTFDFYDHADLRGLANVNTYLTDVIGIVCDRASIKLSQVVNRLQQQQTQLKLHITDGSSHVNITFWDIMAKKLFEELQKPLDEPVIVIFAAAKIGLWKDEVDISHVAATHFYLNHHHHSVKTIRKRLQDPIFSQQITCGQKARKNKLLKISEIRKLTSQQAQVHLFSHVLIKYVDDKVKWLMRVCTNCKNEVSEEFGNYMCKTCKRIIPHPEKRFHISVVASDSTGGLELNLNDRHVRTLIGRRAHELYDQLKCKSDFPPELKTLQNKEVTIEVGLYEDKKHDQCTRYQTINICSGFLAMESAKEDNKEEIKLKEHTEHSTSTYHLDGLSQLKVDSGSI